MSKHPEAKHSINSVCFSRAEFFTTDLGLAAYEGKIETIQNALNKGINWDLEKDYLFISALFGNQLEIARLLIKSGLPITDSLYREIFNWGDKSLFDLLPPNPDIIKELEFKEQMFSFFSSLVEGDLQRVKDSFHPDFLEHKASNLYADRLKIRPIHIASQKCNFEIIEFLLEKGANPNSLTEDGKSALFLVTRCPGASKKKRKACFKLISKNGGVLVPDEKSWFKRWCLSKGVWNSKPN